MKYTALLKPHANSRYQAGVMALSAAELQLLLRKGGVVSDVRAQYAQDAQWLVFEAPALDAAQLALVGHSAHIHILFECREDGSLWPLPARLPAYLGGDLPAVLKYKGKTNETFTAFMLNLALCASDFFPSDGLTVLDPMCSRGTTLFAAVNNGWRAVGVDPDAAAIEEGWKYFKRYLEFHRFKHTKAEKSLTANGKQAALAHVFEFADTAEHFKCGETLSLWMASLDGAKLKTVFKKPCCHLLVADLPYGVQHAPNFSGAKMPSLKDMLRGLLPAWVHSLEPGGAMAISFNTNTLRAELVRDLMSECGLDVMRGEGYDGLEHWVEQAITRDVAVAVKPSANKSNTP